MAIFKIETWIIIFIIFIIGIRILDLNIFFNTTNSFESTYLEL
jgi:hypothetical protein